MSVNSLPKTVNRRRRDCELNPGPSAPESSTLTTRLPSHPNNVGQSLPVSRVCGLKESVQCCCVCVTENVAATLASPLRTRPLQHRRYNIHRRDPVTYRYLGARIHRGAASR